MNTVITLTAKEILELLDFVAPDRDEDQMESEVTIYKAHFGQVKGEDDDGGAPYPAGYYAYLTDDPELGCTLVRSLP